MQKSVLYVSRDNYKEESTIKILSKYFSVQQTGDKMDHMHFSINRVRPSAIVVNIKGFSMDQKEFIMFMKESLRSDDVPLIAYGTKEDYAALGTQVYTPFNVNLYSPIDEITLITVICNQMNMTIPDFNKGFTAEDKLEVKRKKVLIVDDNAIILRTIKAMLEDYYSILLATSGMTAMTTIGRERPDVILLDYDMPICDGRMTLAMLRSNEDTQDLPVFFLTGVADKAKIRAVASLKPQGYILKPPNQEKLVHILDDFFRHS